MMSGFPDKRDAGSLLVGHLPVRCPAADDS